MKTYAESKIAENSNPKRKEYSLRNNNCGTFAADVLKQDPSVKDKAPVIIDSRPNSIVKEYQNSFKSLNYDPKKRQVKIEQIWKVKVYHQEIYFQLNYLQDQ